LQKRTKKLLLCSLVLAGGKATRLGGCDKALLTLNTNSIIENILGRLDQPKAISANGDPDRYAHLGLPILPDTLPGRGPLAGVLSGLLWAETLGADTLLTVPGDTPFIPPNLAERLAPAPAWAESPTGLHPLAALWPIACAPALHTWLTTRDSGRVRAFGQTIAMRPVWFADTPDPFLNINTQADLETARARA